MSSGTPKTLVKYCSDERCFCSNIQKFNHGMKSFLQNYEWLLQYLCFEAVFAFKFPYPILFIPLHHRKLTWHPKIDTWKRSFLLETINFRFHVSFRECTIPSTISLAFPTIRLAINLTRRIGGFFCFSEGLSPKAMSGVENGPWSVGS